eukprot:Nitzschia sp. Nitz4//scaffold278_size24532//1242//1709//NITZ4_008370-RA/size24532-processed-gene-0.1-mRNA-1//1//CDS//3329545360//6134//frame0
MTYSANLYKKNLLTRIGGRESYDMLTIEFTEGILRDPRLEKFYGTVQFQDLQALLGQLLDLSLVNMSEAQYKKNQNKIQLYHYRFFVLGLNASHFDMLKELLFEAAVDSWVDEAVIKDVLECFESLRSVVFSELPAVATDHSIPGVERIVAAFAA